MKRILVIVTLLVASLCLRAQDTTGVARLDTALVGKEIFSVMGSGISINQSATVRQALKAYTLSNAEKKISGYRVRVFYDNAPSARSRSEVIVRTLRQQFPDTGVYLSFESPNYKVTVGDFRTKDEALVIYNALKANYPTAYIIKESINYPR